MRKLLDPASFPDFPLVVIDFEASALTLDSYPIEVGIAVMSAPDEAIENWSSLIKPDSSWDLDGQWDPDAGKIHGIRRWDLRDGLPTAAVMRELNARIPHGATVWCDGGHYDARWLATLVRAADFLPMFQLADLGVPFGQDAQLYKRYLAALTGQSRPHRAGPDAASICVSIRAAIIDTK